MASLLIRRHYILSAAKAPRTDGKGSPYPDLIRGHVLLLEAMRTDNIKTDRANVYLTHTKDSNPLVFLYQNMI